MIHFSAELSSRIKADFNKLSDEFIKVTPALPHTLISEGHNIYMSP